MAKNYGLTGVGDDCELGKAGPRVASAGQVVEHRQTSGPLALARGADAVGQDDLTTRRQWNANLVTQADWYVDPLGGNDVTGDGTIGSPLRTLREVARRFGPEPVIGQVVTIWIKADGPPPVAFGDELDLVDVRILGDSSIVPPPVLEVRPYNTPVIASGTVQSYTAPNPASNVQGQIVSVAANGMQLAQGNIVVINRAGTLLYAACYADNNGNTAFVAQPHTAAGTPTSPQAGDTFEIISPSATSVAGANLSVMGRLLNSAGNSGIRLFHTAISGGGKFQGYGSNPYVGVAIVGGVAPGIVPAGSFLDCISSALSTQLYNSALRAIGCVGSVSALTNANLAVGQCSLERVACSGRSSASVQGVYFYPAGGPNPPITCGSGGYLALENVGGAGIAQNYMASVSQAAALALIAPYPSVSGVLGDILLDDQTPASWAQVPLVSQVTGAAVVTTTNIQRGPAAQFSHARVQSADWYIAPQTGSDSNSGLTALAPLRSFRELQRRVGPNPLIDQTVTVHVLEAAAPGTGDFIEIEATVQGAAQLRIVAEPGFGASASTVSMTPQNSATSTLGVIDVASAILSPGGLAVNEFSPGLRSYAWVAAQVGAAAYRVQQFLWSPAPGVVTTQNPNPGDTIRTLQASNFDGACIRVRRSGYLPAGPPNLGNAVVVEGFLFTGPGPVVCEGGRYASVEFRWCLFQSCDVTGDGTQTFVACRFVNVSVTGIDAQVATYQIASDLTLRAATFRADPTAQSAAFSESWSEGQVAITKGSRFDAVRLAMADGATLTVSDADAVLLVDQCFGIVGSAHPVILERGVVEKTSTATVSG
jgi:hypothetical protein